MYVKFNVKDYFFAFMVFLIFLFCISLAFPSSHKDVKITDWLSLAFNAALTIVGVKGFYLARNWKQSLTEGRALEEGIQLKYDAFEKYNNVMFGFLPSTLEHQLPNPFHENFFDDKRAINFYASINSIYNDLDELRDAITEIHRVIERLGFFRWDLCEDKLREFLALDKDLDNLYLLSFELDHVFNDFLKTKNMTIHRSNDFPKILYSKNDADIEQARRALNEFFMSSERYIEVKSLVDKMMTIRSQSLNSMKVLLNRHEDIFQLITPRQM